MKARYINPYTDFGFKKLFGEEGSIDLLIDFLNELLPIDHKIVSLSFKNPELAGAIAAERRAIFDLHCEDEKGRKFIVEMQKARIKFFKDRAVKKRDGALKYGNRWFLPVLFHPLNEPVILAAVVCQ